MKISEKTKKIRADELLAIQQDIPLEDAGKFILAGLVRSRADQVIKKSSEMVEEGSILLLDDSLKYVSRGAFKLKPALDKYLPDMKGFICGDFGASTGGFTDLMLQFGAIKVYAVDAGHGQLHYKLRQDSRVINLEKVNGRNIPDSLIPEKLDALTMDLSFISVKKVLPEANRFLKKNGWAFILIKPQFEAHSNEVGKGGVVRDTAVINRCISSVRAYISEHLNWEIKEIIASPIKGPKGNQEFVLVGRKV